MRLIVLGDSIARGTFTKCGDEAPLSAARENFARILKGKLGAEELINYAQNGVSYSSTSPVLGESSLAKTCGQAESGDVVLIAGGTNDYGTGVGLGEREDETDVSFYGAADVVFSALRRKNPQAEIYVVLPIPRLNEAENEKGHRLDDYREALRIKAEKYGLGVIDGREFPVAPKESSERRRYMPDGVHPNNAGHRAYAAMVWRGMEKLREKNRK